MAEAKKTYRDEYFIAVNYDRREWIHPHRFGDGLRFKDFCTAPYGMLAGLAHLLDGAWTGTRVAIVGDRDKGGAYELAMDSYKDVSFDVIREMIKCPEAKAALAANTAWCRAKGIGRLGCDEEAEAFYKEVFGDVV